MRYKINKEKSIGDDAFFNVNVIGKELTCVKWIQSQPHLVIITADDQLIEETNNLLTEFNGHVLFSYDTTFQIGDFFVTPLLCRHPFLENDVAFPIPYFYHDSKAELAHDTFFRWAKKVIIIFIYSDFVLY